MMSKMALGAALLSASASGMSTTPMMDTCPMEGEMPLSNSDGATNYVLGWYGTSGPYVAPAPQQPAFMLPYATGVCTATTPLDNNNYVKFVCDEDMMGFSYMEYLETDPSCAGTPASTMWFNSSNLMAPYSFNCMGADAYVAINYAIDATCSPGQSTKLAVNVCSTGALPTDPTNYLFQRFNCDASGAVTNFYELDMMNMCADDKFCVELAVGTSCAVAFKVGPNQTPIYAMMEDCMASYDDEDEDSSALATRALSLAALVLSSLATLLL
jgi:hypothetical protein